MKISTYFVQACCVLSFASFACALGVDWDTVLTEFPKNKTMTYQGDVVTFTNGDKTYLYDDGDTWNNCATTNRTEVPEGSFDSWPDGVDFKDRAKGAKFFANVVNDACEDRLKIIFKKKKKFKKTKWTYCTGTEILEEAHKVGKCRNLCTKSADCMGFEFRNVKVAGGGREPMCKHFETGVELGDEWPKKEANGGCFVLKTLPW